MTVIVKYKYAPQLNPNSALKVHKITPLFSSIFTGSVSLYVPDLAEQRGKLVVVDSPGREHLCVVVAERPQLRQAAQETSKVLRLLRMLQGAQLPQHVQHRLLQALHGVLVLDVGPI